MSEWLRKNALTLVTTAAVIVGGGFVGEYRISMAEEKVATLEAKVETKADKQDVREIRDAIGDIQLDVAQLCGAQFGPERCYTARRHR